MQALRSASLAMATRTRDTATPGKEKRGTSPSPPTGLTQQRRRSPNPSNTNSPARNHDSTATPSEKHIPNYLKSTVSSRIDISKQQGKKPVSTTDHTSAHNPTLTRRRSFEKPPPRTQISRVSPNPTLRSSSFSGKTVTGQKGVLDKNLRITKDNAGKQHSLYARPVSSVKKTSIYVKKQDIGSSRSTTKEQVISPTDDKVDNLPNIVAEPETQQGIQEFPISEAEMVQVGNDDEKGGEDLVLEDQEQVKIEQNEADSDKDEKIVSVELSRVIENEDAPVTIKTDEEPQDKPHVEEISSEKDELKDSNINTDQSDAGYTNEEIQAKDKEEDEEEANKKEESGSRSEAPETKAKEAEKVEVVEEKKEKEAEKAVVVEEKKEKETAVAAPRVQIEHGKRDSAVSNDVIEETATRLREQRKNKLKSKATGKGYVFGVRLRRRREGDRAAGGAGCVPLLRRDGAGDGRAESVEVVLRAPLFQHQKKILLHTLLQAFGYNPIGHNSRQ
ncbi:hypothetical protein BUALT_Bualt10G0089800 [Buddleja alternifolia]|uniref:Uncharacterized protein n=1 Tax=Buddleja alternifolia TaxID=168488 RepID=A0AAV6X830_9LAMI|nr:hypothetical protein BUALT_Bualt10G0089800 [Buddleja alternifolia]